MTYLNDYSYWIFLPKKFVQNFISFILIINEDYTFSVGFSVKYIKPHLLNMR